MNHYFELRIALGAFTQIFLFDTAWSAGSFPRRLPRRITQRGKRWTYGVNHTQRAWKEVGRLRDKGSQSVKFDNAACLDVDPMLFFPTGHPLRSTLELCWSCDHTTECLEVALAFPQPHDAGVWGGTTAAQRRRMR